MPFDFCHTCLSDLAPGEICSRCGDDRSSTGNLGDVLLPGCVLGGKYKVGRLLGRGGFGATYLAWDMNLRVRIAIKEFLPRQLATRVSGGTQVHPYTSSQDAFNIGLEQFLGEARNLARFRDNPGIISVLDFFPENGTGYMVMEYLDGSTLEQYVTANGRLDIPVILGLLIPVADALRACHAAGLIHRDISPDNIFLTSDGRVKVLDFGAARFAIGSRSTNLSVILKEGYAPFEQYQRNGRQGPWTDVYALTATLYRLLTGDLPVTAPDRVAGAPLPPPSKKGVRLPPGLQALLDKGLAIRSEQRYQTIDAFLSDLKRVLPNLEHDDWPDGRQSKLIVTLVAAIHHRKLIISLVAAMGSLAVGALMLFREANPPPSIEKLRARLTAVTAEYRCSSLDYSVGADRSVRISGYAASSEDVNRLRKAIGGIGGIVRVVFEVGVRIWPYCEVVAVLERLVKHPPKIAASLALLPASGEAHIGESLTVDIGGPSFDGYIYVDYFDLEGDVLHLFPNDQDKINFKPARAHIILGRSPLARCWILGGSTGEQLVTLVAATKPLFLDQRAEVENARDYLPTLAQAVDKLPEGAGAAALLFFQLRDALPFASRETGCRER